MMSVSILSTPSQHIHTHTPAQTQAQTQLQPTSYLLPNFSINPTTTSVTTVPTTTPLQHPFHRRSSQPADQSQSRLLSLPPELRNIIWSYLLIQPQTTAAHIHQRNPYNPHPLHSDSTGSRTRFCANILRTCRQTYAEGLPILYGENKFAAHTQLLNGLPSFLLVTRPHRISLSPVKHSHLASLIRRFYLLVRLDTDPRFTARQVESAFSGVDELELDVFQAMYGSCDFEVLRLFEGVRGVGKAVVQGSVGDGRYAKWLARTMMLPVGTSERGCCDGDGDENFDDRPEWDSWRDGNR